MASSPIVTVNLWFDRRVIDEPFVGLPGRAMQWVFDKRHVFGEEASHLSLVSSGASSLVSLANDALIARTHQELLDAIPAVRMARARPRDRDPRAACDVFARAGPAGTAVDDNARSAAFCSRAIGWTPACQRRSRAPRAAVIARRRRPARSQS